MSFLFLEVLFWREDRSFLNETVGSNPPPNFIVKKSKLVVRSQGFSKVFNNSMNQNYQKSTLTIMFS